MIMIKNSADYQVWTDDNHGESLMEMKSFLVTFRGFAARNDCNLFTTLKTHDEFGEIYFVGKFVYRELVEILVNNSALEVEEALEKQIIEKEQ